VHTKLDCREASTTKYAPHDFLDFYNPVEYVLGPQNGNESSSLQDIEQREIQTSVAHLPPKIQADYLVGMMIYLVSHGVTSPLSAQESAPTPLNLDDARPGQQSVPAGAQYCVTSGSVYFHVILTSTALSS
jgi:hypothetical protein